MRLLIWGPLLGTTHQEIRELLGGQARRGAPEPRTVLAVRRVKSSRTGIPRRRSPGSPAPAPCATDGSHCDSRLPPAGGAWEDTEPHNSSRPCGGDAPGKARAANQRHSVRGLTPTCRAILAIDSPCCRRAQACAYWPRRWVRRACRAASARRPDGVSGDMGPWSGGCGWARAPGGSASPGAGRGDHGRVGRTRSSASTASRRFFTRCQRAATCTASGAPWGTPEASASARSRATIVTSGWVCSQAATVSAVRSSRRSTGQRRSRATTMGP